MAQPIILEAALNGVTTKKQNPNVPITPEEIAADALACLDAGATIIHTHCDPGGGSAEEVAERYLSAFRMVWKERPGALLYPTLNYNRDDRFTHLRIMAKEGIRIGVLDPGSMNLFGSSDDGMPAGDRIYTNSFDTIREAWELHTSEGLGPSMAIYEPGFLRTALAFWRGGLLPKGAMVKLYLSSEDGGLIGYPFGLPATPRGLDAYLMLLEGCPLPWAVSAVGADLGRSEVLPYALERGGHVHLGLEFYGGDRTPKNLELVHEAIEVCKQSGRPLANHDQTVQILGLP